MLNSFQHLHLRHGFTLIELLVVVLIIGILAAVAVPQYKKAVFKSRFTQLQTIFNTYMKGIEVYLLANGFPQEETNLKDILDVSFEGKKYEGHSATYLPFGHVGVGCDNDACHINFRDASIAGLTGLKTNPSPWLHGWIGISKYANTGKWFLRHVDIDDGHNDNLKVICQWWASTYGVEQMENEIKTKCAAVGVN